MAETFSSTVAQIPFNAAQTNARGLAAPIMRAAGHILFLLAVVATEPENGTSPILNDEEKLNELRHASSHLAATTEVYESAVLSTTAKTQFQAFVQSTFLAAEEFAGWDRAARLSNLRLLANATASIGALLDRELAGLYNSDPGLSL